MRIYILFIYLSVILSNEIKYVSNINFIGNEAIKTNELKQVISLNPPKLFSRSDFTKKKLNKDKFSLSAYYRSKGYIDIDIYTDYVIVDNNVNIKFYINEGKQYFVRNIYISGNKKYNDNYLRNILGLNNNNTIYNPNYLRKRLHEIKHIYLKNGYIDIAIMDEISINANLIDIRVNIYEGNNYYIRNINIIGLSKIKSYYVNRELTFKSGYIYNIDQINETKDRIFNSRLFRSVEININKIQDISNEIDLNINVREYTTSSIEINTGFKQLSPSQNDITLTGVDMDIKWLLNSILNTSSYLELETRIASELSSDILTKKPLIERDISITYSSPWTLFFKMPFRLRLFHEEEFDNIDEIKNGITYSLLFNETGDIRYEINSTIENIKSSLSNVNNNEERYIQFKYISNNIDEPLNPSGGSYLSINLNLHGTILGGVNNFIKIKNEYRKFLKFPNNNIIAFRIINGYIETFGTSVNINKYKFKLGGHTTLRGWSSSEKTQYPNGNLISNLVNIEYRISLYKNWGTYLFFDSAHLFNSINKLSKTPNIWDYGLGFIYNTNLGPIRLDFGIPYGDYNKTQLNASLLYMF